MSDEVMTFDPKRTTNAQAIADLVTLGYLRERELILDATWGKGRFWNLWTPGENFLHSNDRFKSAAMTHYDYREFPAEWVRAFPVVVFDPDYKLAGNTKDHQTGSGSLNADYGMDRDYKPIDQLLTEHAVGFAECLRVTKPKGYVLHKTMDQVVSGRKMWLGWEMANWARDLGCRLVDQLYVCGYRKQPRDRECKACLGSGHLDPSNTSNPLLYGKSCLACKGEGRVEIPQKHSRGNISVLQVYEKGKA